MLVQRLLNILLLVSFSFCYLEWPGDHSSFFYQLELTILTKEGDLLNTLTHPLILTGILSQLILLICIVYPKPLTKLNGIGILALSLLVLFILLVGLLGMNFKIIASVLPFLLLASYYFYKFKPFGKAALVQ